MQKSIEGLKAASDIMMSMMLKRDIHLDDATSNVHKILDAYVAALPPHDLTDIYRECLRVQLDVLDLCFPIEREEMSSKVYDIRDRLHFMESMIFNRILVREDDDK